MIWDSPIGLDFFLWTVRKTVRLLLRGDKNVNRGWLNANEFIQSCFQDYFLGVLYIKKFVPSTFFCVCLKNFRTNCTDSHLPGLKGASLFWTWSFFLSVGKRCFVRIHVQNSYDFRSLFFLWLVILYLLWQSVVIVTGFHWGFYFPTSNAICETFWADGTIVLSSCSFFCTNLPLIIFHCPLSSHPKDSSTTM